MTIVDGPRIDKLLEFLDMTHKVDGINAEVGVYKGGTANIIASAPKHLMLFDTFEGMPEPTKEDTHLKGDFSDTSLEEVQEFLSAHNNISYYKGVFPQTIPSHARYCRFSLVHLDCDLYESVKAGVEFFAPRMAEGGIIVVDDYLEPNCPGAKKAIDEALDKYVGLTIFSICQTQIALKWA